MRLFHFLGQQTSNSTVWSSRKTHCINASNNWIDRLIPVFSISCPANTQCQGEFTKCQADPGALHTLFSVAASVRRGPVINL